MRTIKLVCERKGLCRCVVGRGGRDPAAAVCSHFHPAGTGWSVPMSVPSTAAGSPGALSSYGRGRSLDQWGEVQSSRKDRDHGCSFLSRPSNNSCIRRSITCIENQTFPNFIRYLREDLLRLLHNERTAPEIASRFSGSLSNEHENAWRDLIADPSNWWDNREGKFSPRSPDFKHKRTGALLWLDDKLTPFWVKAKIANLEKECPEKQWHDLFSDPSHWWDHRSRKRTSSFPDFINKRTGEALWLNGRMTPSWVPSKVTTTLGPGTIQEDIISSVERLSSYNKAGQFMKTLTLFNQMQLEGLSADHYIFLDVLKACSALGVLTEGRNIHRQIVETGCEQHPRISSALVNMYGKCGSLQDARIVFDKMHTRDVVSWTAMIVGCVKCGQELQALELFRQMQLESVKPDSVTFVALLNACASLVALEEGKRIHMHIVQHGCESDAYVCSSLVDMYCKCGSLEDARTVFERMHTRDVVSWTSMVLGCVKCGQELEALALFRQMQQERVEPNSVTFVVVVNACASLAALEEGRRIHKHVVRYGCESDVYVSSSLVDMYAKCGSLEDARTVFDKMPTRNVVSWNAMLMGFAMHGFAKEAVTLFEEMSLSGSEMNEITFICLLSACSHGGLVKEGLKYFHGMYAVYGVTPKQEHYNIMVDSLGRAGRLDDAEAMALTMPFEPCAATWKSLLGSCRIHKNLEMGERAFQRLVELDPTHAAGYVLLSNIYGSADNDEAILVNERRLDDADAMALTMPFEPCAATWKSLLGSCRIHRNLEMGERAFQRVVELDPTNASGYVLLSNIYGSADNDGADKKGA